MLFTKPFYIAFSLTLMVISNSAIGQPSATSRVSQSEEINYLTFKLAHRTLSPQAVTVKKGFYTFRLRNGMLAGDANFRLLEVNGNKTQLVKLDAGKGKGVLDYRLTPGKYELTVVEFPQAKSIITVE
jgi:uncharacterized cupredoxin-like copper-binding protein